MTGIVYVATDTDMIYRNDGSAWVSVGGSSTVVVAANDEEETTVNLQDHNELTADLSAGS